MEIVYACEELIGFSEQAAKRMTHADGHYTRTLRGL